MIGGVASVLRIRIRTVWGIRIQIQVILKITFDKKLNFDFKKFNNFILISFSVEVFQAKENPLAPAPPPHIQHLSLFPFFCG